jgi:predicted GNAT family acetyltransferase
MTPEPAADPAAEPAAEPAENAGPAPTVTHRPAAQRFEASVGGRLAVCAYRRSGSVVHFTHTEVPAALQGRGIAAALVQAALAWARAEGLQVRPACSYVAAYMRRHPPTLDLLWSPGPPVGR